MNFLEIDGDYLEGGGQILRTAIGLSCITKRPIKVKNIRAKRPKPGLKPQHLHTLKVLAKLFDADTEGLKIDSKKITFAPKKDRISLKQIEVDIGTAGAIGLFLQPLLLVAAFKSDGLSLNIRGGTCGLGAVPVDYYPNCVFPILLRSGLKAELSILKRGYYPKGGGEVSIMIEPLRYPNPIDLTEQGNIMRINGISVAHRELLRREVAQRQERVAREILSRDINCRIDIKSEYVDTDSIGSEINLYAHTDKRIILGADARGEQDKTSETVGREAARKLKNEIISGAACDLHLADNIIPWLSLLGGEIKTSMATKHTQTNIWVAEQFFGKIFKVEDTTITVREPASI